MDTEMVGGIAVLVEEFMSYDAEHVRLIEKVCRDTGLPDVEPPYSAFGWVEALIADRANTEAHANEAIALLTKQRDEARALLMRWNRAMAEAGMAGSEFIDDPERCARHFKEKSLTIIEQARKIRYMREEIVELREQIAEVTK